MLREDSKGEAHSYEDGNRGQYGLHHLGGKQAPQDGWVGRNHHFY